MLVLGWAFHSALEGEKIQRNTELGAWTSEFLIPSFSAGNRIRYVTGLDPEKLTNLHTLELRGNQIESTEGINLPNLKNLYLVARWALGWCGEGNTALASGRLSH